MKTQYVVSSPSRTGSTLLCNILRSGGVTDILHTHDCFFQVENPKSTVLIFSARRDLFRSIMSCLIGKRTNIFNVYDNTNLKTIAPFKIDCLDHDSEFQQQYGWHKWYIQSHNLDLPYCKVETFYIEDFVNDYEFIYKKLDLVKHKEVVETMESTYRYKDLIVNHEQCKEIFDYLEVTEKFTPRLKPYDPHLPY